MNRTGFPALDDTQERLRAEIPSAERDRAARGNSVKNALAIAEMEGGQPSTYCRGQLGLFESGKISATEMRDRVVGNASR